MKLFKIALLFSCAATSMLGVSVVQATSVPFTIPPSIKTELACFSLCNHVGTTAQNDCEVEIRADGEATMQELAGCLVIGATAQNACYNNCSSAEERRRPHGEGGASYEGE